MEISSRLVVNQAALKLKRERVAADSRRVRTRVESRLNDGLKVSV